MFIAAGFGGAIAGRGCAVYGAPPPDPGPYSQDTGANGDAADSAFDPDGGFHRD